MKTMRRKHILTACLTAILLMSALSVLALPTGAASYVKSIQNGTGTRSAESIYAPFSYRVNVLGEFTAFGFAMPTWTRDDSVCRLSLYLWSGTYEDTLKQEPIATKVFDPMRDNATNTVTFDPQPAGEYLFHVSEPQGSVGVWANVNPTDSLGYAYKDGTESKSLEPELHITFTENLNEPFGACRRRKPHRAGGVRHSGGQQDLYARGHARHMGFHGRTGTRFADQCRGRRSPHRPHPCAVLLDMARLPAHGRSLQ